MDKLAFGVLVSILLMGCLGATEESPGPKGDEVPAQRDHAQFIQNPYPVTDSFIEEGKAIYEKLCIGCHGPEGEEPFYHSIKLHADRHTYGDYLWIVTYGIENTRMPPFNATLSLEERWKVITYLKKNLAWSLNAEEKAESLTSLDLSIYELDKLFMEGGLSEVEKEEAWKSYSGKRVTWKGQVQHIRVENGELELGIRHKPHTEKYDVLVIFDSSKLEKVFGIALQEYVTYTGILRERPKGGSPYVLEGVDIEGAKITSD
jgi:hypothetical protein